MRAIMKLTFSQCTSCQLLCTMPPVSPLFWLYAHQFQPLSGSVLYADAPLCGGAAAGGRRAGG
jgi:hypothetical protein